MFLTTVAIIFNAIVVAFLAFVEIGKAVIKGIKWTISMIKRWKKKQDTKIICGTCKNILKDKRIKHISLTNLELQETQQDESVFFVEYDEANDEVIQSDLVVENDEKVLKQLEQNDGILVLED
ncbi:hypothetical protein [Treponema sp.]|uniref:hypothetical protein n=1 Tax=Treponema sp. TaxID=166 RepID=UPI00298ECAAE|nr:hypothetical protein [Treponema sp.]MCQ2240139.1 hypothetical protein [Treponema sp.]